MGSVQTYETAAGRRYMVQFRRPDHSLTTRRGFRTKREAQLFLASTELAKASGEWIDSGSGKVAIGQVGVEWLAAQAHLKPSSLHTIEVAWRVHVEPRWGDRTISSIRHSEVQDWVADLSRTKSPTVVLRAYGILAGTLDRAVRDRRIKLNQARGVSLPRKRTKPRHYLTHAHVELLAREAREHKALVLLLAYTGLRWGEAVALRVSAVDFERRRLVIRDNAVNVAGVITPGTPKSGETRSVPFPAFLDALLARECYGKTTAQLVFGDGDRYLSTPTVKDGWFTGARKRAAAQDVTFPTALTIHDLRHTAASLAISAGANVKAVQRMLGHASAAMTLDTYADLFDDDLDAVSAALDDARRAAGEVKMKSRRAPGLAAGPAGPHVSGLLGP
ncbi:MAG: tyrosine-type recombinase/integrase [Amnibacterium sp.]